MLLLRSLVVCGLSLISCGLLSAADVPSVAERYRTLVTRAQVSPNWLPEDRGLWYRVQTGPEAFEFVQINTETGERITATNFAGLKIEATETRTSEMTIPRPTMARTRRNGPETNLLFVNRLEKPVVLSWINSDGEAMAYGTIAPGKEQGQHTYAGHVWRIDEESGAVLAIVTAERSLSSIIIDGPAKGRARQRTRTPEATPSGQSPDQKWRVTHQEGKLILVNTETKQESAIDVQIPTGAQFFGEANWSPTSQVFVMSATVPVTPRQVTIVQSAPKDQQQPQRIEFEYIKPGDPLPQPQPVLCRLIDGAFQQIPIDSALFNNQFTTDNTLEYRWSADGRELYFNYNQRGHQVYRILAVNAESGAVRSVVEETSPTFIDYTHKTWRHWLGDGRKLLWLSERDGWCHLWKYTVDGSQAPRRLTSGKWVIREIVQVDETSGLIWFTASGLRAEEDPYHLHLCQVRLDGTEFRQLTEGDGNHQVEFSPGRQFFVDTWSRVDQPAVTELRRTSDGSLVRELERGDATALVKSGVHLPERFVAKGRDGKTDIHGILIKPSHFDPKKKYPVLENIYAGPHAAFTPKRFGHPGTLQEFAELGFIVVQVDGMGTNFRGKAFHDVCWKNLKDAGFPDRIAWIRSAASSRPWMDLSRVGIYGGSAGGQTAMRALLDHGGFYHAAVADCGCHDNRMDKIWWNEQWMGWPVDDSYARNSNAEDAAKLQGHLLLIVGELDRNVDPASTTQVVAALQKAGKQFEYMPIINAGHGAAESPYGAKLRRDFLVRHLHPEAP